MHLLHPGGSHVLPPALPGAVGAGGDEVGKLPGFLLCQGTLGRIQKRQAQTPAFRFKIRQSQKLQLPADVSPIQSIPMLLQKYPTVQQMPQSCASAGVMLIGVGKEVQVEILLGHSVQIPLPAAPPEHVSVVGIGVGAVGIKQPGMQLVVIHRGLLVYILVAFSHLHGGVSPGNHKIPHLLLTGTVVENVIVGHLPHAQHRVAVL